MPAYINSISNISPYALTAPDAPAAEAQAVFTAADPAYRELLNPGELRRMPRLVKMGLYASTQCLAEAGLSQVDAIAVGSGLGSFEAFDKFETAILQNAESTLPPTAFIQSLDNAVAGQIALSLQCYGYNMTYTHRGFSFETALLDSLLLLEEGESQQVLLGGLDEATPTYVELLRQAGHLKAAPEAVERSRSQGVQPGEGATFMVLSGQRQASTLAEVQAVRTLFRPRTAFEVEAAALGLLKEHGLTPQDLSLVLVGHSGDAHADEKLHAVEAGLFGATSREYFKNYCGEYHTASAFAVWLGVQRLREEAATEQPRTCLILNQYRDTNYSFILLRQA